MKRELTKTTALSGEITIPGDKSISHRAVMFASLAEGKSEITNFLMGQDCLSTISCFREMGTRIDILPDNRVQVEGNGLFGLRAPSKILDVGNSGTTTRLMSGILAGQKFTSQITGDASIQSRPMGRIIKPLSQMGAKIFSLKDNGCAPLQIDPSALHGIHYTSPVASAQVKSCILLAGLYADQETSVTEPVLSRDHTERMLRAFGAQVTSSGVTATIYPHPHLSGRAIDVPGDISSAAYPIAAALLVPGSQVLVKNVGTNPTRDGLLRVLEAMGADITRINERENGGELAADLLVRFSSLHGTTVGGELIPTLIDEIPMIAVLAAFAEGTTVIRDAAELKVKESDRIAVVTENLRAMGADITPTEDGMIIEGGKTLHGAAIHTYGDHRIAMSFAIAAMAVDGVTQIDDAECAAVSYPGFYEEMAKLSRS